ncbi:glycosyltransferase [Vibrio vulnificus]|uniref:glycosyltransferase family 2 protein n=1 Tax=Vibrio vulnificus TaxID=672 RepID=UPI0013027D0F|nr:glycosyltransferase [Vibrio vulnificus]EIU7613852.1 glycosyltransferase [Vibrio vulnificus]EIU7863010.1 glycosyltransferase [Vibrio vulnificus]MCU8205251.1 glycosyltransferase [Vibrio vulnificus]MCU8261731.1 glycosyltransferase [Vibrio vulnificus]MCU8348075.1 glycosyltransferase [Vibrio vulnificus]
MNPKVSVCIITYNHERYIERCLLSILNQEVNFEFEIIVGEDCSTDSTREIISRMLSEYPDVIKPMFKEKNLGGYKNYISVHEEARGKYICHIDGDDYMLPGKLQKCVDVLDSRPEIGIVFHRMMLDYGNGKIKLDPLDTQRMGQCDFEQKDILAIGSIACHSSRMYRSNLRVDKYPEVFLDYYIDVIQTKASKAHIINEPLGGYSVGVGVASVGTTKFLYMEHLKDFLEDIPEYSGYIGSNMLTVLLSDVKNRRCSTVKIRDILDCGLIGSMLNFLKYLKFRRYINVPKL